MPDASIEQALARAERIRTAIGGARVTRMRRELGPVTVSVGVDEPGPGRATPESLMASADRALYAAKAGARDRVRRAEPGADPA
jgi:diguanylate cyclase (GGDEF)-like protein